MMRANNAEPVNTDITPEEHEQHIFKLAKLGTALEQSDRQTAYLESLMAVLAGV